MNSEDGKRDGEQEIDQIYQKIAGNFDRSLIELQKCSAGLIFFFIIYSPHCGLVQFTVICSQTCFKSSLLSIRGDIILIFGTLRAEYLR